MRTRMLSEAARQRAARVLGLALSVAALAAVAGCDGSAASSAEPTPGAAAQAWTEPDHYAYTLLTTCGERGGLGLFRVWVRGGQVERAKPLRHWSDLLPLRQMPTVGDIIQLAAAAQGGGADDVHVTRAPDGRPRWVSIDYLRNAIDDEACYRVTDLMRLGS
jgi:Family of unknown function (DUF6174)